MAGCGLFGKVRPRRDFIAIDAPRPFLALWEPWLQQGLSESRRALGPDWQPLYLTTPIWRFWLGADLCGSEAIGALMPSIDGAGRCFPLTLVATCARERGIMAPDRSPLPGWFAAAERVLLGTLDDDARLETIKAALAALAPPETVPAPAAHGLAGSSVFWTEGGEVSGPTAFVVHGLPAPAALTGMIERGAPPRGAPFAEVRDAG